MLALVSLKGVEWEEREIGGVH